MKIELYLQLQECLAEEFSWSDLTAEQIWAEIDYPPKKVEAHFASTIAFQLAATAKRKERAVADWEPSEVARRIEQSCKRTSLWALSTSARGHLNVVFLTEWYVRFYEYLANTSGAFVMHSNWRVGQEVPVAATVAGEGSADAGATTFGVVPLRAYRTCLEELAGEYHEFLLECGFAPEELQTPALAGDDLLLMLLARHCNSELDSASLRLGLYSSENVPWLMKEFSRCWRVFTKELRKKPFEAVERVTLATALDRNEGISVPKRMSVWIEDEFIVAAIVWLAQFRAECFVPMEEHAGSARAYVARSATHIFAGVGLFFAFYNHPNNRQSAGVLSRRLVKLLAEAVEGGLRSLLARPALAEK